MGTPLYKKVKYPPWGGLSFGEDRGIDLKRIQKNPSFSSVTSTSRNAAYSHHGMISVSQMAHLDKASSPPKIAKGGVRSPGSSKFLLCSFTTRQNVILQRHLGTKKPFDNELRH